MHVSVDRTADFGHPMTLHLCECGGGDLRPVTAELIERSIATVLKTTEQKRRLWGIARRESFSFVLEAV